MLLAPHDIYGIPRGGGSGVGSIGHALVGLTLLDSPQRVIAVSTNREINDCQDVLLNLSGGVIEVLGGARSRAGDRLTLTDRVDSVNVEDMNNVEAALILEGIMAADQYGPATLTVLMRVAWGQTVSKVGWLHTVGARALTRICV